MFLIGQAFAQQVPRFDVAEHCETIANVGSYSAAIENACIEQEQSSYNSIKDSWAAVPEKTRTHCHRIATVGSDSYQILVACVESELEAIGQKPEFKF